MQGRFDLWEQALDQPGSADEKTMRYGIAFAVAICLVALFVLAFGHLQLAAYPQFSTLHAGFVFLADAITSFMLFGQFRYRRLPFYAILATAYLFNALVMLPFLLSFPGALKDTGWVIGGTQSSIWTWHLWHLIFPLLVVVALLQHRHYEGNMVAAARIRRSIAAAVASASLLALGVGVAVTYFHDWLPVLITNTRVPLTESFYLLGALTAGITALAALLCWYEVERQRSVVHLWLTVALIALLADALASLAANGRYTIGWYFGRVESMVATSVLLLLFLSELNRLYAHLATIMRDLLSSNTRLAELVREKEALVESLRASEEHVRQLAYYDPLTELPNRRLLMDRLQLAVSLAKRHRYSMAIMFMDLDRFKQVNDNLGHEVGDKLLRQVAVRLTHCMRSGDTASRSGGDEFVIVLTEIARPQDAALVAEKIIESLREPVIIDTHRIEVTTSIGIAIYPIDGEDDMRDLMNKADAAMYAAKQAGRNRYRFYAEELAAIEAHPVCE